MTTEDPAPGRFEVALYKIVRAISPLDWVIVHGGLWLAYVFEFDPVPLDTFMTFAQIGVIIPRSEWSVVRCEMAGEFGPWSRRVAYKSVLIVAGFPIVLFMSAASIFPRIPCPPDGYLFGLIKSWGYRAAFRGVYSKEAL